MSLRLPSPLLLGGALLLSLAAPLPAQSQPAGDAARPAPGALGYWNGPDWQGLEADGSRLGLHFDPGLSEDSIRLFLGALPGLAAGQDREAVVWPGHTVMVRTAPGTTADQAWDLAALAQSAPQVHRAAPLLVSPVGEPLYLTDEILVRWHPGVPTAARETWTAGLTRTATLDYTVNPGEVWQVPADENLLERANELALSGLVEFALPDFTVRRVATASTNDPLYGAQWHLESTGQNGAGVDEDIDVEAAWDLTRGTASITVAVVDTGTELQHPDLVDNLVQGVDVLENDFNPQAEDGCFLGIFCWEESHGTSVSGVSAGRGDNGIGTSGVAPRCTVMPIRFLSELFGPQPTLQDEADAFNFACTNGAAVINNSWGPGGAAALPASTKAAIDNCNLFGRGGLGSIIFFAAGNSGTDNSGNGYASYDGVIGVSAVNDQGVLSSYSSFGASVDCSAPSNGGVNGITTTDRLGNAGYSTGDYTDSFGGTSSASPTAAGVMALILSANPSLTRDQAIDVMLSTAEKVDPAGGNYNGAGHSIYYGYGRVNAGDAVAAAAALAAAGPSNGIYLNGDTFAAVGNTVQYQFSMAPTNRPWFGVASITGNSASLAGHPFDVASNYTMLANGNTGAAGSGSFSATIPAGAAGLDLFVEVASSVGGGWADSNAILLRVQ